MSLTKEFHGFLMFAIAEISLKMNWNWNLCFVPAILVPVQCKTTKIFTLWPIFKIYVIYLLLVTQQLFQALWLVSHLSSIELKHKELVKNLICILLLCQHQLNKVEWNITRFYKYPKYFTYRQFDICLSWYLGLSPLNDKWTMPLCFIFYMRFMLTYHCCDCRILLF